MILKTIRLAQLGDVSDAPTDPVTSTLAWAMIGGFAGTALTGKSGTGVLAAVGAGLFGLLWSTRNTGT